MSFVDSLGISYLCMKTKLLSTLVFVLAIASTAFAEVTLKNGIGDRILVSVGRGVTLAKPVSIDLMPTNAPVSNASYSVRCRVIYEDDDIPSPTEDSFDRVQDTWELLNKWLGEFVSGKYAGMEYEDLITYYYAKELSVEINDLFPVYVKEQLREMAAEERPKITTVTVEVEADGEFRAALIQLMESDTGEEQN